MSELRDREQPDRLDTPDEPRDERPDGGRDRPRLQDAYVDDEWDIFHGAAERDDRKDTGEDGLARQRDDGDAGETGDGRDTGDDGDTPGAGGSADSGEGEFAPDLDEGLSRLEADHPEAGSVLRKLAADRDHPLDLTRALHDPRRRDEMLAVVRELAEGRLLRGGDLRRYLEENPGRGVLFAEVPAEVNHTADGLSRKDIYLARCEAADPVRRVGALPDSRQREAVAEYERRLVNQVEPLVWAEAQDLAASLPGATVSARTKSAVDILNKVSRMASGSDTRPPREDYRVGHVVDAVGARITVGDTEQLGRLMKEVCDTLGVGDGGRVLELDNMYAAPKASNPSYRVIPLLVAVEANGIPYTYELQLTTRRASVAADMEHNTIYKPYVGPSTAEREAVRRMLAEAAALDQNETRRAR